MLSSSPRCPTKSLLLLVAVWAFSGCSQSAAPVSLFGGFDYEWEFLSHRISYLRAGVSAPDGDGSMEVRAGIVGGPFSLNPAAPEGVRYGIGWAQITSSQLVAHYGSMELSIDSTGHAEALVQLDDSVLPPADYYVVALQGLEFDTDVAQVDKFPVDYDPIDGWTPEVLGAGVQLVDGDASAVAGDGEQAVYQDDAGQLSVRGWLEFKAGPLDRPDMNEALQVATIGGQLHYVVLAIDSGVLTTSQFEAEAYYPISGSPYSEIPPLPVDQRTVTLEGVPGLQLAAPLLHGFRVRLNRELGGEGRYLRALALALESFEYSAERGSAEVVLDAYCSHSSLIEEGDLQVDFEARVGMLQIDDDAGVYTAGSSEGNQGAGPFELRVGP